MSRYEWPPLPDPDPARAAASMAEAMQRAWDDLEEERVRVAESLTMGRKQLVDQTLRDFQAAIDRFEADVAYHLERYATLHLGPRYMAGVINGGGAAVWNTIHAPAFAALATDTYDDFLARSVEAKQTAESFAAAVREAARKELPKIAGGGRTARQVAQRLTDRLLADYNITAVTYRDGSRVPVRVYAEMVARTKSAVAYSVGTLREFRAAGGSFVEVFDGSDCGWTSHGSPDKANGTVRHVDDADANLISHPRCTRAFGPRPDLRTRADAKNASPSTTAEQRADAEETSYNAQRQIMAARGRQVARDRRQARRAART